MKLEIDIPSILYNDAKENRRYISVNKMEIAWKAIADGKPLEQDIGKWIVKEESAYPCRGRMRCECDRCGYTKNAEYRDLAYGDTPKYIMPQFCEKCGNKKSNIVIYPTK